MPTIKKSCPRPWIPKKQAQSGRRVDNSKFYQSALWRRVRRLFLLENPLCAECESKGIITPARVVDHIIPMSRGGSQIDESNLQALCDSCHNKKSAKESRS